MRLLWLSAVVLAMPLSGCSGTDDDEKLASELNVNSQYTIESVNVSGQRSVTISSPLRSELDKVVGGKLDHFKLQRLAERMRTELRGADVKVNVTRGSEPDHVIVNFEIVKTHEQNFDLSLAKFLYDSQGGWTADGTATTNLHGTSLMVGLVSDGDSEIERFAGIRTGVERKHVGTDRLRVRFEFEDYHAQWNLATIEQAPARELYRSRQVFTPEATVILAQPLEWSFGVSFARLTVPYSFPVQSGSPSQTAGGLGAAAAKTESSNAVVNTLRYHRRWGSAQDAQEQEVTGMYSLVAATNIFNSDRVFVRHATEENYRIRHGRDTVKIRFLAGVVHGDAPYYERFVLGDATTLRGWNKFVLDPLGGSHVIYGSVDNSVRVWRAKGENGREVDFQTFYDTGAVWDRPQEREQKQSLGAGFRVDRVQLAVAFPLRSGRVEPIFFAGMNFQ